MLLLFLSMFARDFVEVLLVVLLQLFGEVQLFVKVVSLLLLLWAKKLILLLMLLHRFVIKHW